ncbi:hypothetical protein [Tissierella carlieri]|uniref:ABC-2 family transporter protein n=1 Tax=Tissierella carlieri TaxID=689904 RepID=A0ABT1SB37_9FIRM|nr:hypothetical protein [Tissierella carlieri]MCQ4923689.1 hypothetical protein [Tissierella carlieri]MDU5081535.1 hypothetical protein [Bacillota bacterium]
MRKYMKYEIKGSYKFILGIIAIVLIASTIIQLNISRQIKFEMMGSGNDITGFGAFMLVISMLVIFGAFLTAFFQIIGSFRKELYEDRGYLTFTLPLTGNKILGAKLVVAIIWFTTLGVSIVLYNLLFAMILYGPQWAEVMNFIKEAIRMINSSFLSVAIVSGLSAIMTLILIYFSMALSRVSVRNKKIGGLWFIIFIILSSLSSYLMYSVSEAIPYFLSLDSFKIFHSYELNFLSNVTMGQVIVFGNNFDAYINIFGVLSLIVISIGAFLTTGYLIEKKIDL